MNKFDGILRVIVPRSTQLGLEVTIHSLSETKKLKDEPHTESIKEYDSTGTPYRAAVFHHLLPGTYRVTKIGFRAIPKEIDVLVEAGKQKDLDFSKVDA